jgi:hypothetical protein
MGVFRFFFCNGMQVPAMRGRIGVCFILALWPAWAWAAPTPGADRLAPPLAYPGKPKPAYDEPKPPFAMRYTDEAAQSLGFRDGSMEVFSSRPLHNNPLVPVFSGGISGGGPMLRLQWRPGS